MDYRQYSSSYAADGFVVIRQFLPPDELELLNRNLDRYIHELVPTLPASEAFYQDRSRPETLKQLNRLEQDSFFAEYRHHSRWNAAARALLGEEGESTGAEWFNKPPLTEHATPPHQDNFYFCLTPPRVLTMWLALDIVDEENGCLRYVRGSHLDGVRSHQRTNTLGFSQGIEDFGEEDRKREVAVHAAPGDLLIHHGNTIHRAEANRSSMRHRRSFAMVFRGENSRRDEAAYSRYLASAREQHLAKGVQA